MFILERLLCNENFSYTEMAMKKSIFNNFPNDVEKIRIFLEVLATYKFQIDQNISFFDSAEILLHELDLSKVHILENKDLKPDVLLHDLGIDKLEFETLDQVFQSLSFTSKFPVIPSRIDFPPSWMIDSLISLTDPEKPILFINTGNLTIVPLFLSAFQKKFGELGTYFSFDQNKDLTDQQRLLISLADDDLNRIRSSVLTHPLTFGTNIEGLFGTIFLNLLYDIDNRRPMSPSQLAYLSQFLDQELREDGRIIIYAPATLLNSNRWSETRNVLKGKFHIESIADFSFPENNENKNVIESTIITLKKPHQVISKQITLLSPADFEGFNEQAENPLEDLVECVISLDEAQDNGGEVKFQEVLFSKNEFVFDIPSTELTNRWDAKYYCPGRKELQNRLINIPDITWLGSISDLITYGTNRSMFIPFSETSLEVDYSSMKKSFAPLRVEDEIWLNLIEASEDQLKGDIKIRVERRSGSLIGYLPDYDVSLFIDTKIEFNERYPATIIDIEDDPSLGKLRLKIQYSPPNIDYPVKEIKIIRPRDIQSNRLLGGGEKVLISKEKLASITTIITNDIILYPGRDEIRSCVVPSYWEGSACHQDMVIIRPKTELVDSYYLLFALLYGGLKDQLRYLEKSAFSRNIDLSDLEEVLITLPSLADQRRIALDFADGIGDFYEVQEQNQSELFIDGHNLIPYIQGISLSDPDDEMMLIQLLQEYCRFRRKKAVVYFDQAPTGFSDLKQYGKVQVHFVHQGRTADEAIIAELLALGTHARNITVVSSDRQVQQAARAAHARVVSSKAFTEEWESLMSEESLLDPRNRLLSEDELAKWEALFKHEDQPQGNIKIWLDEETLPIGKPTLLSVSCTTNAQNDLKEFKIVPSLSPGEFIEEPQWELSIFEHYEIYTFTAYVRFSQPGSATLICDISFTQIDGSLFEQSEQIALEITQQELVFAPIEQNPYITGSAVDVQEMFFGREDVLEFLRHNLIGKHQSNVIVLQGNRRTGKTSILKQTINRDLFAPHIPVYIDCQGLGKLTDQKFFYKIAREIWRTLRKSDIKNLPIVKSEVISDDDPFSDFRDLLDEFSSLIPNRKIILLIDEFEVIDLAIQKKSLTPIILENLRHLFQHWHDLAIVLTGSYRLRKLSEEYWSALFGLGLKHNIGFLDETSARKLITQPLSEQVKYSNEAINLIIKLTACQPYFLQMICHNIVTILNEQETSYVTSTIVEEASIETLTSADGHFQHVYKSSGTPISKAVVVFLASSLSAGSMEKNLLLPGTKIEVFIEENRLPIEHYELQELLRELSERDIIAIEGGMGNRLYGFKIDLVRQWIRRNYDLQSAISLAQSSPYTRED